MSSPRIAREIYRAVANGLNKNLLRKYPKIIVDDKGAYWSVSQAGAAPGVKARHLGNGMIEAQVTQGGGQLQLSIDKCNGTVASASYSR